MKMLRVNLNVARMNNGNTIIKDVISVKTDFVPISNDFVSSSFTAYKVFIQRFGNFYMIASVYLIE